MVPQAVWREYLRGGADFIAEIEGLCVIYRGPVDWVQKSGPSGNDIMEAVPAGSGNAIS